MTIALALLSPIPVLIAYIATGDFPQLLMKPPHWLVFAVFHHRALILALNLGLYLAALLHGTIAPTSVVFLFVVGALLGVLGAKAFLAVPYVIFPAIRRAPSWVAGERLKDTLAPDAPVLGLEVSGDVQAFPLDLSFRRAGPWLQPGGERLPLLPLLPLLHGGVRRHTGTV